MILTTPDLYESAALATRLDTKHLHNIVLSRTSLCELQRPGFNVSSLRMKVYAAPTIFIKRFHQDLSTTSNSSTIPNVCDHIVPRTSRKPLVGHLSRILKTSLLAKLSATATTCYETGIGCSGALISCIVIPPNGRKLFSGPS